MSDPVGPFSHSKRMQKHIDEGGEFSPSDSVNKYSKIDTEAFVDSINEADYGRQKQADSLANVSEEAYQKMLKYRRMVKNANKRRKPK